MEEGRGKSLLGEIWEIGASWRERETEEGGKEREIEVFENVKDSMVPPCLGGNLH